MSQESQLLPEPAKALNGVLTGNEPLSPANKPGREDSLATNPRPVSFY